MAQGQMGTDRLDVNPVRPSRLLGEIALVRDLSSQPAGARAVASLPARKGGQKDMAELKDRLTVAIGCRPVVHYDVVKTNAPRDYDGFGTVTVFESGSHKDRDLVRIVLIRVEHAKWQTARYASGLHTFEDNDLVSIDDVIDELWKRLNVSPQ